MKMKNLTFFFEARELYETSARKTFYKGQKTDKWMGSGPNKVLTEVFEEIFAYPPLVGIIKTF
jgi:hypothetical protein